MDDGVSGAGDSKMTQQDAVSKGIHLDVDVDNTHMVSWPAFSHAVEGALP